VSRPPASPFDAVADGYDHSFSGTEIGRRLRAGVRRRVEGAYESGDRVLELGCGTGEDALWLARRGVRVLATDASSAMLEVTQRKADEAGLGALVQTRQLDLARLDSEADQLGFPFDGALSNFGPLNCVHDRTPVARALARLVRPGGLVAAVLMGPFCPWEVVWHLLHLEPATAVRRLRQGRPVDVGGGETVRVWYPSPARLQREFADGFRATGLVAIGCFLPPPYLAHLADTRPRLVRRLARLESRWQDRFPFTWCGDHYLMSLERNR
jgi:ubiquinone/menaquinone biosynthesis C-methylase UbiE